MKGIAGISNRDKSRTLDMALQLEGSQREMEMQRSEIRRLREQVHTLLAHSDSAPVSLATELTAVAGAAERPKSSQEARLNSAPRQARASSALR